MAGAAVIGALRVILGADTAAFEAGLKRAEGQTTSFVKSITKIASGIGLERHLTAAIDAFVGSIKDGFKAFDNFAKASQKLGVPVEELQELKFAAEISEVSFESLNKGMRNLGITMREAAVDAGSRAAQAFQALGISVKDAEGNLRPTSEILNQVAAKFATYEDGAGKAALAQAIFKKGGDELIPLLNKGATGIEELKKRFRALGLTISQEAIDAGGKFIDKLDELRIISQHAFINLASKLLPALDLLVSKFTAASTEAGAFNTIGDALVGIFRQLNIFIAEASREWNTWVANINFGLAVLQRLAQGGKNAHDIYDAWDKKLKQINITFHDQVR